MGVVSRVLLGVLVAIVLSAQAFASDRLKLVISVDWEGREISAQNLKAIADFRAEFPSVRLLQFLNAAYYFKPGAKSATVTGKVNQALKQGDELGLHIHAWKRLFEASGVQFRKEPSAWGPGHPVQGCEFDCGHEIAISAYSRDELQKVIRKSLDVLQAQGFGRARSFRAGAWLAAPHVREALVAEGIQWDSSDVPVDHLEDKLGAYPLFDWIRDLWPNTPLTAQPYRIEPSLAELPDNGGLADYVDAARMLEVFEAVAKAAKTSAEPLVLQFGFHQETAATYLPQLRSGLRQILARAKDKGLVLDSITLPQAP